MNIYVSKRGFSLIELMVALSIFSIVMTIAIGTLLILIDANGKAQALSSATTNLSFAMDSITRNLRIGSDFNCVSAQSFHGSTLPSANVTSDCTGSSGNTAIVFTPGSALDSSTRMAYRYNSTDKSIEQWIDIPSVNDGWVPITSTEPPAAVTVNTFRFIVNGSQDTSNGNYEQPNISLIIQGTVKNGLISDTSFEIQSNVTQRVLNY